jgi:hypothetical protein
MNVTALTINDLVEQVIAEAPKQPSVDSEPQKIASPITAIADKLDKLASEIESQKQASVSEFKADQAEKRAALTQIVKTYLELESSK